MTTEFKSKTDEKCLDIDKLIDKPYSELNEAEIEFVIEYKAEIKARDEKFKQTLTTIKENSEAQIKAMQEQAIKDNSRQDALYEASVERMKKAMGLTVNEQEK